LIGLYSGLRIEEIGGLRCEDIRTEDGVMFFAVEPYEGHTTKTDTARRVVPIHSQILAAGFERYLRRVKDGGNVQ